MNNGRVLYNCIHCERLMLDDDETTICRRCQLEVRFRDEHG